MFNIKALADALGVTSKGEKLLREIHEAIAPVFERAVDRGVDPQEAAGVMSRYMNCIVAEASNAEWNLKQGYPAKARFRLAYKVGQTLSPTSTRSTP